ncbi:MAG: TonB-dependent receptor [Balneolaceae bacterium]
MHFLIKINLLLAVIIFFTGSVSAQSTGDIKGKVHEKNDPVISATVGIKSLNKGTFTDSDGDFILQSIPAGEYLLFVSAVGYKPFDQKILVKKGEELYIEAELQKSITELDQVVVTGTMTEMTIKESPVKVSWISNEVLNKSASENIMDAVKYINGLYNQVECAVCGTNSIRINGMDGPYTAVLIDGMPVMGALAAVYGLNGLNPNIIQNLEIIKGPNSTLYGSQAMGGVVNIITVDPKSSPLFSLQTNTSTHSEHNFNLSFSPEIGKPDVLFSSSLYQSNRFIDDNNDGFSDFTEDTRFTFFNKWRIDRPSFKKTTFGTKVYVEDRLGGVEDYNHSLRGSEEIYGESVYTKRLELFGSYDFPFEQDLKFDASYAYHDQDSYYGDYHYRANQQTLFSNLTWENSFSENRDLLAGATFRYDALDQRFNYESLPGGSNEQRFVPGLFLQYDHIINEIFRTLFGFRADHHEKHGIILSPRLNVKIKPGNHTTMRFNAGTGFRIVNLFTEEHEAMTGSRQVVVAESLKPEKSRNLTVNLNQIIDIGSSVLNADLDVFYTRFSNQIIPDYENPEQIVYANLNGHSISQGISLNIAHNFIEPFTYMVGVTVQDVFRVTDGVKYNLPFSPDYSIVFNATYTFTKARFTVDYTGRINGRMMLPEYPDRSRYSDVFTEQNLKITKGFKNGLELFAAAKNLLNYTQDDPIIAPDRPFSSDFATDYVFGPIQGRRFLAGISISLD